MKIADLPVPLQKEINNWYYANIYSPNLPSLHREAWTNVHSSIKNNTELSNEAIVLLTLSCLYVESRSTLLIHGISKFFPELYLFAGHLREPNSEDKESNIIKLNKKKYVVSNRFASDEFNQIKERLLNGDN